MMEVVRVLWLAALVACGRIDFDATPDSAMSTSPPDVAPLVVDVPPATGDCPPAALLCDDFETGDLSKWSSTSVGPAGSSTEATPTRPRTGMYSLESYVEINGNSGAAHPVLLIAPRSTGMLAIRLWMNLASPFSDFDVVTHMRNASDHFTSAASSNTGTWASTEHRGGSVIDYLSVIPVPAQNTWTCVELVFYFDLGRFRLMVDEATVLDEIAATPLPSYTQIAVGAVRADENGVHVFIDDVVISTAPIGCN